jgi:hypothetical protein
VKGRDAGKEGELRPEIVKHTSNDKTGRKEKMDLHCIYGSVGCRASFAVQMSTVSYAEARSGSVRGSVKYTSEAEQWHRTAGKGEGLVL